MSILSALVLALVAFCCGGYFGGHLLALAWDAGRAVRRFLLRVLRRKRHGRVLFRLSIHISYRGDHAGQPKRTVRREIPAPQQQLPVLSGVVVEDLAA